METIWIGDFRCNQLQNRLSNTKQKELEYTYIIEDYAEYTWFNNTAVSQLPLMSLEEANVVIMLGFNDCVRSCVWPTAFDIETIARNYRTRINKLIKQYPKFKFFICSINPVSSGYPFAEYNNGIIPADALNEKIKQFNTKIKVKSKATFINSFQYFNKTSFTTRDGVRFTPKTCKHLQEYIVKQFNINNTIVSSSGGLPEDKRRTTAPSEKDSFYFSNDNPFYSSGYGMPNCTAYAWGRFYEILGERPKLSTGNARDWYNYSDGYKRGKKGEDPPQEGAVICWTDSGQGDGGHVAIIEKVINKDSEIEISESAWGGFFWKYTTIKKEGDEWVYPGNFSFQGFIYNPKITNSIETNDNVSDYISKSQVTSSNEYLGDIDLMRKNARYIWQYFGSLGWTLNAVSGILGNMQRESTINPGLWQSQKEWIGPAYGLVQWDPFTKITDWQKNKGYEIGDIDGQLLKIKDEFEASKGPWIEGRSQWITKPEYPLSFEEFSLSKETPEYLTEVFLKNYERAGVEELAQRQKWAKKWFDYLQPYSPRSMLIESETKFSLFNLKADKILPTKAQISFLVAKAKSATYSLTRVGEKTSKEDNIIIKADEKNKKSFNLVNFTLNNLIPNSMYNLTVEVLAEEGKSKRTATINITTPEDLPESVSDIKLIAKDLNLSDPKFTLFCNPDVDFGYWQRLGKGYLVHLIINGKSVAIKDVKSLKTSQDISLKKYFNSYKEDLNLADTIQIGIQTYVGNEDAKITDSEFAKTSNPIYFLKQSVATYLNIK